MVASCLLEFLGLDKYFKIVYTRNVSRRIKFRDSSCSFRGANPLIVRLFVGRSIMTLTQKV